MNLPALRLVEQADRPDAGAPVVVRELSVAFGANQVLDRLSLSIAPGEFVAIVGRSGCGKSTLLRAIMGLVPAGGGSIEVDRATARLVFQEPRLLPWATVRDNVAVGAPAGLDRAERDRLIDARLAEVGLADKAEEWPGTLSGGQRQRVALARALISRPRLLALDEPLGALDALTRIEMQALVEAVWTSEGFSALLVTHDVAEAVALADRVVVLEAGRVALDLPISVARPRRHGDAELATLEGLILDRLLGR
ncbi:MAG: ABC transporter ATP-binding protein [Pseudomonadota bacterium]|jgi:sulfonate transport system ATP-binding protein|uniref:Alkanesulfonates ABC transporter ATP-binding protein / Sulfonate ABC transporter, ATP-binding subunit SsuB n=1 Tax=hydrothermal vent metagenome TaxID=652676 RepID=A0A170PN93_9ZZZZ